jgi:murein DD-endopeptidase MepM/ murein hydrolase activator NlpD
MYKKILSIIIALMFLLSSVKTVNAQDEGPNPVYIVQSGENLTQIAEKFGISVTDLIAANDIVDSNVISEGTQLIIPGITGISGVLTTTPVEFGETFSSILRRYKISQENFQILNAITSPAEIYVGSNLILPEGQDENAFNNSVVLGADDSLLGAALRNNLNPWYLGSINQVSQSITLPNEVLFFYSSEVTGFTSSVSEHISKIELSPLPIVQGHTSVIRIYTDEPATISGTLGSYTLSFFRDEAGQYYYALQGIHALAQPGLMDLRLDGQFDAGDSFSAEQMVLMESGNYPNEELTVESTTIEQEVNERESAEIAQIVNPITQQKMWNGVFRFPVDGALDNDTMAFSSYYGSRRSYNGGQYFGFHGGLDFMVVVNSLNVYAPAPGVVAFTGTTDIRGNTIFIDHGQGIYTGYAHLSEIQVNVGDQVEVGQIIGQIGKTGRVTGPHLHWDIWVNGNAVDPFDWVDNIYP